MGCFDSIRMKYQSMQIALTVCRVQTRPTSAIWLKTLHTNRQTWVQTRQMGDFADLCWVLSLFAVSNRDDASVIAHYVI